MAVNPVVRGVGNDVGDTVGRKGSVGGVAEERLAVGEPMGAIGLFDAA